MPINKRLYKLALCGAVIILLAGLAGFAELAFVLVNLILLSLWLYDMIVTPSVKNFEVSRALEVKLSLAVVNDVVITVRNKSNYGLEVYVTDDVPRFFNHTLPLEKKYIPAHGEMTYEYSVTPLKRGEFFFPAIHIQYRGLLGLCFKKKKFETFEHYKVYPNMKALSDYRISSLNRNMFMQGLKKTRTASSGGDFDSLREYTVGDDFRRINWSATARKGDLIMNTYTPEKNQHVAVMLDCSRVMNSEINGIKKLDYSINSAFLLADYVIRGGDNIGLMVFDSEVRRYLNPAKGPAQFDAIADNLYNIEANELSASYDEVIKAYAVKQKRRSLIFIFTELFNSEEAIRFSQAVRKNLSKHMVFTITINDPRIAELAELKPQNKKDIYVKAAAVKINDERKKIRAVLTSAGILNTDISPDKLSLEVVGRYIDIKRSGLL